MKAFRLLVMLIIFTGLLSGCFINDIDEEPEQGLIAGKVDIGPLCPVEPCNLTDEQVDAIYDARKIIIYDRDSVTVVKTVGIAEDRTYKAYVVPGRYVVDINYTGIDHSSDVPKAVIVGVGEIVIVDISIDTGIR